MWNKAEYEASLSPEQLAEDRRRNDEQAMVFLLFLTASHIQEAEKLKTFAATPTIP